MVGMRVAPLAVRMGCLHQTSGKHALEKLKKRVEELTPRRRDRGRVLLQKGMDGESLLQKAGQATLRHLLSSSYLLSSFSFPSSSLFSPTSR